MQTLEDFLNSISEEDKPKAKQFITDLIKTHKETLTVEVKKNTDASAEIDSLKKDLVAVSDANKDIQKELADVKSLNYTLQRRLTGKKEKSVDDILNEMFPTPGTKEGRRE